MDSIREMVRSADRQGIRLWLDDQGQLRFRARQGSFTPEMQAALKARKAEVIALLREEGSGPALPHAAADPQHRHHPFPLTDIQEAYWLGREESFELHAPTHFYEEYACRGLDIPRLEQAWQRLIARHDMLHATLLPGGEQQVMAEIPTYAIPLDDLREADAEAVERHLQAVRERLFAEPFDPQRWPLFALRISQLPGDELRIHLAFDMLIADWGSYGIVLREWGELYRQPERPLPALPLTFRDYVLAERRARESDLYRRAEGYWRERLAELPPPPELPLAGDPALLRGARFRRHQGEMEAARWDALKAATGRRGLTATGLLLTLFAETLARWSRHPRFTLNLTLFNRLPLGDHEAIAHIVGDFTSLTMLAVDHGDPAATLAERAKRMQQQLWRDLEHRHFSGVEVLRALAAHQGSGRAPMPVVFTSGLGVAEQGLEWLGEAVCGFSQTPQVWLDCQVEERDGRLIVSWDVLEALFPPDLIPTMLSAYLGALERLVEEESRWDASRLDLLPPGQLARRREVNATGAPLSAERLHTLFLAQAGRRPAQKAVIAAQRTLSYRELADEAAQVARWLRDHGAERNQLVAVVMEKGWEQVVAVLGVLIAGAAYLPIDPELPAERQRYLLEQGEVQLVLTQGRLEERLPCPERVYHLCIDALPLQGLEPLDSSLDPTAPEDLAYVIYTSGSTGQPKGVVIDHRGAVNTILDINRRFRITEHDRVLALSALNFDLSVYDLFGILAAGGTLVMPAPEGRRDPSHWAELMTAHGVSVWNTVPALMQMLVDYQSRRPLACPLRQVMMSGDWIPLDLPGRIRELWPQAEVTSLGGATEASIWSIYYPIGEVDPAWHSVPYGRPLANQTFQVLNERLEPTPEWVPGQLHIGGIGLALGYWRDEERSAASFFTHPVSGERLYRTGDLGRYLPDGNIEFLGREDHQVKIRGHRIELGEIEYQLASHPEVHEAIVIAHGEGRHDRQLVAYVVADEEVLHGADGADRADQAAYGQEVMRGVLSDPLDRLQFKLQQHGVRQFDSAFPEVALPAPAVDDAAYLARQSYRRFLPEPVGLEEIGRLLGCLHPRQFPGAVLPKYRYGSAGSLYPIQAYLYVKPGRVGDLAGGCYYYHPLTHRLVQLSAEVHPSREHHGGTNAQIFDDSAFSLFLVAEYQAIEPMYGQAARDFCLLEAGYISQLLMMDAAAYDLGLCPIGGLDFEPLRSTFGLSHSQEMVHSFLGGAIAPEQKCRLEQGDPREANPRQERPEERLEERLGRHLAERLPEYMVPGVFMRLSHLPLSANGKVDRKALPQPEPGGRHEERAAPANEQERQLIELAQKAFAPQGIGATDDFFEMGADSIDLIGLHGEVTARFGKRIAVNELFRHATVRGLAGLLEQAPALAGEHATAAPPGIDEAEQFDRLAANLDGLSEEEVEQWLAKLNA